jgi:hypothetical protein
MGNMHQQEAIRGILRVFGLDGDSHTMLSGDSRPFKIAAVGASKDTHRELNN